MGSLRIIAGTAKGIRLQSVPGADTRPITDRAKEALFNILGGDIEDSTFLDLFAGTGSVGIEALSRGARFARFLDIQHQAILTIHNNLDKSGFKESSEVKRMDALATLRRSEDRKFDYIFIAPPQYKGLWKQALSLLDDNGGWLEENGWVIVQIHPVEFEAIEFRHLSKFDHRKYGSVMFVFYQKMP